MQILLALFQLVPIVFSPDLCEMFETCEFIRYGEHVHSVRRKQELPFVLTWVRSAVANVGLAQAHLSY